MSLGVVRGVLLLALLSFSAADLDLETAAVTVYRNPEFFRHLSDEFNTHLQQFTNDPSPYGPRDQYQSPNDDDSYFQQHSEAYNHHYPDDNENQQNDEQNDESVEEQQQDGAEEDEPNSEVPVNHSGQYRGEEEEDDESYNEDQREEPEEGYKYPGEPKKPNPPARPAVNVHFDRSPDFNHPPRVLPQPNGPKKKGRGPYGHPRYDGGKEPQRYSEEYEQDRYKTEEEQLAEVEEESQRHRNEEQGIYPRRYPLENERNEPLPLQIYHQGQRYPVLHDEYVNHEPYYESENRRPTHHVEDFRETKKGTREYLKHHRLPPHHELEDFRTQRQIKPQVTCNTVVKPKKRKTYFKYRVKPIYAHYRVVPVVKHRKVKALYYTRPTALLKRSAAPTPTEDDSAYDINSELDEQFQQRLRPSPG